MRRKIKEYIDNFIDKMLEELDSEVSQQFEEEVMKYIAKIEYKTVIVKQGDLNLWFHPGNNPLQHIWADIDGFNRICTHCGHHVRRIEI